MHEVIANSSPGALYVIDTSLLVMKNHDFLLMFYCNLASIMHRFVYTEVFKLPSNDVTAKSPLGAL